MRTADKSAEDFIHKQWVRSRQKSSAVFEEKEGGSSQPEEPQPQYTGFSQDCPLYLVPNRAGGIRTRTEYNLQRILSHQQ
jgi:hypothetical protein